MRLLHLASPCMKGDDVKKAQRLLRDNKYGHFKPGEIDGCYGPQTAQATHRAKYWLGYPKAEINKRYGQKLHDFLRGANALPVLYRYRRKRRIALAQQVKLREKALNVAKTQLGYRESGTNVTKYGTWYHMQGPWCAMFVSWCYYKAGSKAVKAGARWSYVPTIYYDAKLGRNNLTLTTSPKPGDLVLFQMDSDSAPDHVGLFEKWIDSDEFYAVEGNTDNKVARKRRAKRQVKAFVHIGG